MLIGSIGAILAGAILWLVIGPTILYAGLGSYTTGWIFKTTHYYLTPIGWLGVGLGIAGLAILMIGIGMVVVVVVLELTKKDEQK